MTAVLLSIKPEWWEKILSGEKTLEIRKTHPRKDSIEWPVTVLVYVSGTGAVQGQFRCPGEVTYRHIRDLSEMTWIFYTALRNAGADVPEAIMLTREYLIATIHGKNSDTAEG